MFEELWLRQQEARQNAHFLGYSEDAPEAASQNVLNISVNINIYIIYRFEGFSFVLVVFFNPSANF